jgi:hypothetical protein
MFTPVQDIFWPPKPVGLDDIHMPVIKVCSEIFVPVLKFVVNLSLLQQAFSTLLTQATVVPVLKKAASPLLVITDLPPFSNIFYSI